MSHIRYQAIKALVLSVSASMSMSVSMSTSISAPKHVHNGGTLRIKASTTVYY
jgi:hypothetical protein